MLGFVEFVAAYCNQVGAASIAVRTVDHCKFIGKPEVFNSIVQNMQDLIEKLKQMEV